MLFPMVYKTLVLELIVTFSKCILNTSVHRFQLKSPNSQDQ